MTDVEVETPEDPELEAEIVRCILVIDIEPVPGLGDPPPGEPEESYLEEPQ